MDKLAAINDLVVEVVFGPTAGGVPDLDVGAMGGFREAPELEVVAVIEQALHRDSGALPYALAKGSDDPVVVVDRLRRVIAVVVDD